jgi:hypothetical protein
MTPIIVTAVKTALSRLATHARVVCLANTDEATFRLFVLAAIKEHNPSAECQTEWHRHDLLVQLDGANTLVEFKYYLYRRTRDLDGSYGNWKGEAGPKNEGEFRACLKKLHECGLQHIHHKYLILVYERPCDPKRKHSFTTSYDNLKPDPMISDVQTIEHAFADCLTCKVLTVS